MWTWRKTGKASTSSARAATADRGHARRRGVGGKFPTAFVEAVVNGNGKSAGDKMVQSHGSTEMPVWGPVFRRVERDQDLGLIRLNNPTSNPNPTTRYNSSSQGLAPSTQAPNISPARVENKATQPT